LRYYLAVTLPEYRDSDFYWKEFQAKNNNELADILGNFINRTLAFAGRNFKGIVPRREALNDLDKVMLATLKNTPMSAGGMFETYRFREGVQEVMNLARAANKYFNDSEPWKTAKSDPARCGTTINISLQVSRALAILMSPVIPASADKIWSMLGLAGKPEGQSWEKASDLTIPDGHRLGLAEILFTKIEDDVIEDELNKLKGDTAPPSAPEPQAAPPKSPITIDDFKKLDLRVAKIAACEGVPKSEKLLKLRVEVGAESRQIIAGIAQHYKPEDLVGKSVVVVYNLQPAKLMGQESQGMMLAASDNDGRLVFISPSADFASGSVVR
jgi:methionyl-tRNA synthetase